MTTTIAVIGANGQVGSEVCLFLSEMDGIEVVPICRSELGAAPLRSWGLESRFGALTGSEEARRLLAGCHLVADFTLPRGDPGQMRAAATQVQFNSSPVRKVTSPSGQSTGAGPGRGDRACRRR